MTDKKEEVEEKPKLSDKDIFDADRKMSNARARLLLKQPFYGVLLSMTSFIPENEIPTMATDGCRVFYNPKYVLELNDPEVFGVLMHEISHCIYLHCTPKRRQNRDQHRWNISCDFAINLEIKDLGYSLPQGILLDNKYRDMNAEMIYDALPKDVSNMETLDTHFEPSDGSTDWDDMEDRIITAYEATKDHYDKSQGKMPHGVKRWIDKMRKNRVKWERIFHKYVGQAMAHDDYSYSRPNKRYISQDIYLPDLRNHIIGDVVVAIDTSGSITPKIIEQFAAELAKISYLVDQTTVLTCDAKVHEVVKLKKLDSFLKGKIGFVGGGGTDFRPVFDKVKELKLSPELLIYLTDTYGSFPDKAPTYPVIWCITDEHGKVPWGNAVYIPSDEAKRSRF